MILMNDLLEVIPYGDRIIVYNMATNDIIAHGKVIDIVANKIECPRDLEVWNITVENGVLAVQVLYD